MYLIFALLIHFGHATGLSADVDRLYHELLHSPPRGQTRRGADVERFCAKLRQYLKARAAAGAAHDLGTLLDQMAAHAEVGHEQTDLFAALAQPGSGLTAREVSDLMMSGRFLEHDKTPLSPARAIQKTLRVLPIEEVHVEQWYFDIFEELARHVSTFEQWDELADFTRNWAGASHDLSRALVSNLLPQLQAMSLKVRQWYTVFSFYQPEFVDSDECARIVDHFATNFGILKGLPHVPDPAVRLCLQEAAIRKIKRPSQAEVRTLLRPVGLKQNPQYVASLQKLEDAHMKRAWKTDCGSLFAAATNDAPVIPPRMPPQLSVILGGLKESP